jgi:transcriptional regulator with XRE-family HTH domain
MAFEAEAYSDYKRDLGVRIARLRAERGMSQRKFALVLELDRVTLNRIEAGKANPTIDTLARIAEGLGVSITELLQSEQTE